MATVRYTVVDGEIIAEKRNGVRSLYVPDALGSTVALLDNTQTITDTMSYWPYGEVQARTGTNPTPFLFGGTLGMRADSATRTYASAKVVETSNGRWMTAVPSSQIVDGENSYTYADDNPGTLMDGNGTQHLPFGHRGFAQHGRKKAKDPCALVKLPYVTVQLHKCGADDLPPGMTMAQLLTKCSVLCKTHGNVQNCCCYSSMMWTWMFVYAICKKGPPNSIRVPRKPPEGIACVE